MATEGFERVVVEVPMDLKRRIDVEAATEGITLRELLYPVLLKAFPKKEEKRK